jgi:MFS family permease
MARATEGRNGLVRPLAAAILANAMAGLLYVWSLFILPLETGLQLNRAALGAVSSLALVTFTIGVFLLPPVLRRLGHAGTAAFVTVLIGGGHVAFGLLPGLASLFIFYGVAFGVGSGLAYGLALALAAALPDGTRAKAIGLVLSAFAMSGILLPLLLGKWVAATDPAHAFMTIGLWVLLPGLLCLALLWSGVGQQPGKAEAKAASAVPAPDIPFFVLSFAFFSICFVGLAIVSQVAAMAAAAGLAAPAQSATALTVGYLLGSLIGAPLADRGGERSMIALLGLMTGAGAAAMLSGNSGVFLAGSLLQGLAFGGSGAVLPVLIGRRYGSSHIPAVYGRMMFAYGLAGLTAPGIAGALYAAYGSYTITLALCVLLAALAIVSALFLTRRPALAR